jgi:hypothetical protein
MTSITRTLVLLGDSILVRRIEKAADDLKKLDWRIYSLVVVPVSRIESESPVRTG